MTHLDCSIHRLDNKRGVSCFLYNMNHYGYTIYNLNKIQFVHSFNDL